VVVWVGHDTLQSFVLQNTAMKSSFNTHTGKTSCVTNQDSTHSNLDIWKKMRGKGWRDRYLLGCSCCDDVTEG
jgi:hypothetical protein